MTVASPVTDMISYKNSTSSAWGRMRISASQRIDKLTTVPSCRNQRTSKVVKEKGVQCLLQTRARKNTNLFVVAAAGGHCEAEERCHHVLLD